VGIEYRIRFHYDRAELDRSILELRFFVGFDAEHRSYLLRFDPTITEGMPNAWVSIEPDGLYFCDNGGEVTERAVIFRTVIELALKHAEKIEVEEL
jgi:hypothetical protein